MLKRLTTTLGSLVLLSLVPWPSTARALRRPGLKTAISSIDAYCRRVDAYVERHIEKKLYFAEVRNGDGSASGRWRRFASDEERDEVDSNSVANVWLRDGTVVLAVFTLQSDSRDWAHYVSFYYRGNRSLAKLDSVYNTFYGDFSIERMWHYGENGSLLDWRARYLDLTTRKPKRLNDEFLDQTVPLYRTTRDLPFSRLLALDHAPNDRLRGLPRGGDD